MANNEQDDKELNDYLDGNSGLSKSYRASSLNEPPSSLDDAILSAAKEAVENTAQKEKPIFHKSRWTLPVSIAAMVTLSVSLVVTIQQETGQSLISEPEIEMFGDAALIEEVVMPQVISADSVLKQELKAINNNEKDRYDTVSGEAALGAVGGYRAPVNLPDRVRIEVMERLDKNKNVDEVRASASAALGAAAGIYRAEEKADAPKARMKEAPAKKILLKEKTQLKAVEERVFSIEAVMEAEPARSEFDDLADMEQSRERSSQEDILLKIKTMWEQGELIKAKQAYESFTKQYPGFASERIKEIIGTNIYSELLGY